MILLLQIRDKNVISSMQKPVSKVLKQPSHIVEVASIEILCIKIAYFLVVDSVCDKWVHADFLLLDMCA